MHRTSSSSLCLSLTLMTKLIDFVLPFFHCNICGWQNEFLVTLVFCIMNSSVLLSSFLICYFQWNKRPERMYKRVYKHRECIKEIIQAHQAKLLFIFKVIYKDSNFYKRKKVGSAHEQGITREKRDFLPMPSSLEHCSFYRSKWALKFHASSVRHDEILWALFHFRWYDDILSALFHFTLLKWDRWNSLY